MFGGKSRTEKGGPEKW